MLNFTTTTIINDGNNIVHSNGSTIYKNGSTSIGTDNSGDGKFIRVNFGPKLFNDGTIHKAVLTAKQAYVAPVLAKATVTLPTANATNAGIYRIAMYIRLRNNNNPYFYNNWTFKGRPLYIEFTLNSSGTESDHVDSIISYAKKYMTAQYGYDLVKFSKNASNHLEITAADQWEIFMDQDSNSGVKLQVLKTVDSSGAIVTGTTTLPTHEEFVASTVGSVSVDNGNEAFGDFAHIVKDLRLPTAANRRWQGIAEGDVFGGEPNDDKPNPSGHYTQYTIQYTSERGVLQQTAVGGLGVSRTVHVFYVASGATDAFDAALAGASIADAATLAGYTAHTDLSTWESGVTYYTESSGTYSEVDTSDVATPVNGTTYYTKDAKITDGGLV
jgi:hypothetical protein